MAVSAKVGHISIDSTITAGNTKAYTGLGFQPKALIFWWGGGTATANESVAATINAGIGFTAGSTKNRAVAFWDLHAAATTDTGGYHTDANCIAIHAAATDATIDGLAALSSFDADGFTLLINDQFTANYTVNYLALGGSDLTNADVASLTQSSAASQSITGLAFQPNACIIIATPSTTAPPSFPTDASIMIGFAANGGAGNNRCVAAYSDDALATSDTFSWQALSRGLLGPSTTLPANDTDGFVNTFNSDGITVSWPDTAPTNAFRYHFLFLAGLSVYVGDLRTNTNTTSPIVEQDGWSFAPAAVFAVSNQRAGVLGAIGNGTAHGSLSIGAFTSTSERRAMAFMTEDNVGTQDCGRAWRDDCFYIGQETATPATIRSLCDVQSINLAGFTAIMDDADTAQIHVSYIAFGPTPVAADIRSNKWWPNGQQLLAN